MLNYWNLRVQNLSVSKCFEVILSGASKNQANTQGRSEDYVQEKGTEKKGLKNVSMNKVLDIRESTFGIQEWLRFHIWFIITLYYKMWQILLQNATAILLQNATKVYYRVFITKYNSFIPNCKSNYKMLRFFYKKRQLLQHATLITKYTITGCTNFRLKISRFFHNSIHNLVL